VAGLAHFAGLRLGINPRERQSIAQGRDGDSACREETLVFLMTRKRF
jgi:hypothetical protein